MAKDQHPVQESVDQIGADDSPDNRRGLPHGLQGLAEHHEQQEGKRPRGSADGVRGREWDDLGGLTSQAEVRRTTAGTVSRAAMITPR